MPLGTIMQDEVEYIPTKYDQLNEAIVLLQNKMVNLYAEQVKLKRLIEDELAKSTEYINLVENNNQQNFKVSAKKKELDAIEAEFIDYISNISSRCSEIDAKEEENKRNINQILEKQKQLEKSIQEFFNKVLVAEDLVLKCKKEFESKKNALSLEIKEQERSLKDHFQEVVSKITTDFLGSSSVFEMAKRDFMKKFEGFELDISNSQVKSDNNFHRLYLIEKQIESIFLLIKKNEIGA